MLALVQDDWMYEHTTTMCTIHTYIHTYKHVCPILQSTMKRVHLHCYAHTHRFFMSECIHIHSLNAMLSRVTDAHNMLLNFHHAYIHWHIQTYTNALDMHEATRCIPSQHNRKRVRMQRVSHGVCACNIHSSHYIIRSRYETFYTYTTRKYTHAARAKHLTHARNGTQRRGLHCHGHDRTRGTYPVTVTVTVTVTSKEAFIPSRK
jgi:hypothetical protein